MNSPIAIVDLFSGPGGLGEGFSAIRTAAGGQRYQIDISIEKEASAHRTLRLRSFLRRFAEFPAEYYDWTAGKIAEPDWPSLYPSEWKAAEHVRRPYMKLTLLEPLGEPGVCGDAHQ